MKRKSRLFMSDKYNDVKLDFLSKSALSKNSLHIIYPGCIQVSVGEYITFRAFLKLDKKVTDDDAADNIRLHNFGSSKRKKIVFNNISVNDIIVTDNKLQPYNLDGEDITYDIFKLIMNHPVLQKRILERIVVNFVIDVDELNYNPIREGKSLLQFYRTNIEKLNSLFEYHKNKSDVFRCIIRRINEINPNYASKLTAHFFTVNLIERERFVESELSSKREYFDNIVCKGFSAKFFIDNAKTFEKMLNEHRYLQADVVRKIGKYFGFDVKADVLHSFIKMGIVLSNSSINLKKKNLIIRKLLDEGFCLKMINKFLDVGIDLLTRTEKPVDNKTSR